ncbi:Terpenoid synthase 1 [Abeliophyllum distichum]|uniref:Terpenoid synthase 1 n=1 Tax=Abeliophyllum distichum TaxID=126358 RepID=A0ABD1RFE1_9LAMI
MRQCCPKPAPRPPLDRKFRPGRVPITGISGARQPGADIFKKFKDENARFKETTLKTDARGLLSLYKAAWLRLHEEDILEDGIVFPTANLKSYSMATHLSSARGKQIAHDSKQSLHFGSPRIEARNFISIYEKDESKNELLVRFSKLDYNSLKFQGGGRNWTSRHIGENEEQMRRN